MNEKPENETRLELQPQNPPPSNTEEDGPCEVDIPNIDWLSKATLLDCCDLVGKPLECAVKSVVTAGKNLVGLKEVLPPEVWNRFFNDGWAGISEQTAKMLIKIALNQALTDKKIRRRLPLDYRVLFKLSRLTPNTIRRGVNNGSIYPDMPL